MADLKISQFADGGAIQPTDEIATNRAGINTKVYAGSAASLDAGFGIGDVITWQDIGGGNSGYPAMDGSLIFNLSVRNIPTMPSGGMNFDGSTYLNGNPLTGIQNGRKGTIFFQAIFEDEVDGEDVILLGVGTGPSGNRILFSRTGTQNGIFVLRDTNNSNVFDYRPSGVFPTSGLVNVIASWDVDLGIMKIYINGTRYQTSVLNVSDIDYTSLYSIGVSPSGTEFFAGDINFLYFNSEEYLDLDVEENRLKFHNTDGIVVPLGAHGEKVTGNKPILFMGYDAGLPWSGARGSAESRWTLNGTAAAPSAVNVCELEENAFNYGGSYIPTLTAVDNVSSISVAPKPFLYSRSGDIVEVSGAIINTATAGSETTTTYRGTLPVPTDITDNSQLIGVSIMASTAATPTPAGWINGDTSNENFVTNYKASSTSSITINNRFSYRIE